MKKTGSRKAMTETTHMGSNPTANGSRRSAFLRYLPLVFLAGVLALVLAMGWHRYVSLEVVAEHRSELKALVADNYALALLGFAAAYTGAVALSIPGAAILTLLGGFLFGWLVGGVAVLIAATFGATLLFLIAKTALGDVLAARAGPLIGRLRDGFREDAFHYLLFLRLVPAFPFWLVNLAPAILGVSLRTYVIGTAFGILPATFAYAAVGDGLDAVFARAQADYDACIAASGAAVCKLSVDASALVNPTLLGAFAALGVVALIPVVLKRWRKRGAA